MRLGVSEDKPTVFLPLAALAIFSLSHVTFASLLALPPCGTGKVCGQCVNRHSCRQIIILKDNQEQVVQIEELCNLK